jgi:hypothetical protein
MLSLGWVTATHDTSADQYDGLTPSQKEEYLETCAAPPPQKGSGLYATDRSLCWDGGDKLKVQFLDGSAPMSAFVLATASEWSRYANVTFVEAKDHGDIRITFSGRGFSSRIGRDAQTVAKGKPTMTLGFGESRPEDWKRHVLHEFGHVLGFSHEHQSPAARIIWNEKTVLKYYMSLDPPWTERQVRENILNPPPPKNKDKSMWTKFDPLSIMLYSIPKEHTQNKIGYSWNKELSPLDKSKASDLYRW